MLHLVFKDLLIQKKSLAFALLYIVFFMFVLRSLQQAMLPAAITAFTYILVMGAFALDDKNKADVMLNSLPVKRTMVVTSKYLSVYLFSLIGIAAYFIMYLFITLTGISLGIDSPDLSGIFATLVSVSVMNSIQFPLLFKLGYTKARTINLVMFFAFFVGVPAILNKITVGKEEGLQTGLMTFLNSASDQVIVLILLTGTLLILLSSWLLSVKLYSDREF